MHRPINLTMSYFFFLFLHLVLAQSGSTDCNSACMNYLTALANEKNIANAAVWDYSGPVTAPQIATVCSTANPLACCNCGGTGLTSGIETEVLAAWALTCNTYNTVQDGGTSAVTCWTSHFHQGCTDYDNLLEGGSCGSGGGSNGSGNGNPQSSGSGNPQSTERGNPQSTGSGNPQSTGNSNPQSTGNGNAQSTASSSSGFSGSKTSNGAVSQTPSKSDGMSLAVQNQGLMIVGTIFAFVVNTVGFFSGS